MNRSCIAIALVIGAVAGRPEGSPAQTTTPSLAGQTKLRAAAGPGSAVVNVPSEITLPWGDVPPGTISFGSDAHAMAFVLQGPLPAGQAVIFLQQPADDPCLSRNCGASIATLFGPTWARRGGRIVVAPGEYRMYLLSEAGGAEVTLTTEAGSRGDRQIDLSDPVDGQVRTLVTSNDSVGTFRGAAVLPRPGLVAAAVRSSRIGGARTALEACRYSPDSDDEAAHGPDVQARAQLRGGRTRATACATGSRPPASTPVAVSTASAATGATSA